MKILDRYTNKEPVIVPEFYDGMRVVHPDTEIPAGTVWCVNGLPTNKYKNPCFECTYNGQWFSYRFPKEKFQAEKNNTDVQRIMQIIPALNVCEAHVKHNIRKEVSAEEDALACFFLEVYGTRYLPPAEMREKLKNIRNTTGYYDRVDSMYERGEKEYRKIYHDVCFGHFEYLCRQLDSFLETGVLNKQLCWFLHTHHLEDIQYGPRPDIGVEELTSSFTCVQAEKLLEQEYKQRSPYPFRYAAYIIYEHLQLELFKNGFNYKDIKDDTIWAIIDQQLIEVGYPGSCVRPRNIYA